MVEQKCWGTTEEIQRTDVMSLHRCEVQAGGYCSMHYHRGRDNVFITETASIVVIELYGSVRTVHFVPPRSTRIVRAHVPHRFAVIESGLLWELYWPNNSKCSVDANDIVRFDQGGQMTDLEQLARIDQELIAEQSRKRGLTANPGQEAYDAFFWRFGQTT